MSSQTGYNDLKSLLRATIYNERMVFENVLYTVDNKTLGQSEVFRIYFARLIGVMVKKSTG